MAFFNIPKGAEGLVPVFESYEHSPLDMNDSQKAGWYWRVHDPNFEPDTEWDGPYDSEAQAIHHACLTYAMKNEW